MNQVKNFRLLGDYLIWIMFQDGIEKVVDFKPFLGRGFTAELLVPERFSEVYIEEGGGLAWPNGYDFCPNYLHDHVPAVSLREA